MKLANCILLASLALGTSFANATAVAGACTANPGGTAAVNRAAYEVFLNGKKVDARVDREGTASAARESDEG